MNLTFKYWIKNQNPNQKPLIGLRKHILGDAVALEKLDMHEAEQYPFWGNASQTMTSVRYPILSLNLFQKCLILPYPDISIEFYILTFLKSYYTVIMSDIRT